MARDTRRRFEVEAQKHRRSLFQSFMQTIADIKRALNFGNLTSAIESRNEAAVFDELNLRRDYYGPFIEALRNIFIGGADYQLDTLPRRAPGAGQQLVIRFQGDHPRARHWLESEGARSIVDINERQRQMVREVIDRGIESGANPRATALELVGRVHNGRRVGGVIGLTSREAASVQSYRQKLTDEGRKADQIDRMTAKLSNKLLKRRGERIARTETIRALNAGRQEGIAQLIESGQVDEQDVKKVWDATGDARTRTTHAILDGQKKPIDEPFTSLSGARLLYPGDTSLGAPAAEIVQCRCYHKIDIDFLAKAKRAR